MSENILEYFLLTNLQNIYKRLSAVVPPVSSAAVSFPTVSSCNHLSARYSDVKRNDASSGVLGAWSQQARLGAIVA